MLGADGGENGIIGRGHAAKFGDFASGIGSHFGEEIIEVVDKLCVKDAFETKDSVEGTGSSQGRLVGVEDLEEEILGCGFTVRAGDTDKGKVGVIFDGRAGFLDDGLAIVNFVGLEEENT